MAGEKILDEPPRYGEIDIAAAGALIRDLPDQLEEGAALGRAAAVAGGPVPADVAIFGMGGSGIVGKVLAAYLAPLARIPVDVVRDFEPPAWVNETTLAVLVSYSGDTLETLTAGRTVVARRSPGLVVTSGGRLRELAAAANYPCIAVPAGRPPRCALGYMAGALMAYFGQMGWYQFPDVGAVPDHLRACWGRWGFDVPTAANAAKQLALRVNDAGVAAIYGAGPAAAVAAERCRAQLAENAKFYASGHAFPELCHNELVAFEVPTDVARRLVVVVLRPAVESAAAARQVDAALELIAPAVRAIVPVRATGGSVLVGLFELIYFGDLVSYYLALLRGVDPTPVRNVTALKRRLAP